MKKIRGIVWCVIVAMLCSFLPAYALPSTVIAPEKNVDCDISVMTYNVLHDGGGDWQYQPRLPLVLQTVRRYNPDLIGFQESTKQWNNYLKNNLPDYTFYTVNPKNTVGEAVVMAFRTERFELLDQGYFYLCETPEVRAKGWDATDYRLLIWNKLYDKQTGKTILQGNTHLYFGLDTARFYGAKLVNEFLQEQDIPFFCCGDYNSPRETSYYQNMIMGKVGDSYYMTEDADSTPTYPTKDLYLDYILVNEETVKVLKHDVIDDTYYGMTTSDHSAVIAYYDFAEEKLGFSFAAGSYNAAENLLQDITNQESYTFALQSDYGNKLEVYSDAEMTQKIDPAVTLTLGENIYYLKVTTIGGTLEEKVTAKITFAKSTDCSLYQIDGAVQLDETHFSVTADSEEYIFSAKAAEAATVELFTDAACSEAAPSSFLLSETPKTYYVKVTAQAGNFQVYELSAALSTTRLLVKDVTGGIDSYIVNERESIIDIGYVNDLAAFPAVSFDVVTNQKWYSDADCQSEATFSLTDTDYYLKVMAGEREKVYKVTLRKVSALPDHALFVNPAVKDAAAGSAALCYGGGKIYLAKVGERVFSTIVEAVAAAKEGDTVFVAPGTYNEYVVIDKPITLYGANYDISPITRGDIWSYNSGRRAESYMYGTIEAVEAISNWSVSGFYFAGDREDGANIEMNTDTVPLYNITFEKNVFSSKIQHTARSPIRGYGSSPKIITIRDNYYMTTGNTRAFTMRNLEDLRIENNYICDAQTLSFLSAQVKLDVSAPGKNNVTFIGNRVEQCKGALNLYATYATEGVNWIIENNEFYGNSGTLLYLELGNHNKYPTDYKNCNIRIVGNKFKSNGTEIKFAGGSTEMKVEIFGNRFYKSGTNVAFNSISLPYMDLSDNYFEKDPVIAGGFSNYTLSPYWTDEAFTVKGGATERDPLSNEYFVSTSFASSPAGVIVKYSGKAIRTKATVGVNAFGSIAAAIEQIVADGRENPILYLANGTYTESVTIPVSLTVYGYFAGVDPVDKSGETIIDRWNIVLERPRGLETTLQGVWTVAGDEMTQFTLDGVRINGLGRVLINDTEGDQCHVTIQNIVSDSTANRDEYNGVFAIGGFACTLRYYVTIRNMYVRTNQSPLFDKIVAQQVTMDNVFYGDNRFQFFYGCLPKVEGEHLQEPVFFHVTNSMFWNTDHVLLNFSWTDYNGNSGNDVNATERTRMDVLIDNNVFVDTMRDAASSWVVRPQFDSDNIFFTITNNTIWQREHSDGAFIYTFSHKKYPDVSDQMMIRRNRFIGDHAQNAVIGIKNGTVNIDGNYFADSEAKPTTPEKYAGAYTAYSWYYLDEDFTRRSDHNHVPGETEHKEPTCKEQGYDRKCCTICGETVEITWIPKINDHIEDPTVLTVTAPTCKETGLGRTVCKVCGVTVRSGIILEKVKEHTEDKDRIVVDRAPDCKTPGEGHTECSVCGERMQEKIVIPVTTTHTEDLEHIIVDKKPTCGASGMGHTVCKVCGITMTSAMYINATGAHTSGEWQTERYPSFTTSGVEVVSCTTCKKELNRRYTTILSPLPDVTAGQWYYAAVEYTVARNIFAGVAENGTVYFKPNDNTTRAQVVSVLARIAGIDTSQYTQGSFTDVKKGSWYEGAVNWAAKSGITAGTTPTTFAPNDKVTREQFASFLFRFAKVQYKKEMPSLEPMISFSDAAKISSWAREAVTACVRADIINGVENQKAGTVSFNPKGDATRAQLAVMIRQFMVNVL